MPPLAKASPGGRWRDQGERGPGALRISALSSPWEVRPSALFCRYGSQAAKRSVAHLTHSSQQYLNSHRTPKLLSWTPTPHLRAEDLLFRSLFLGGRPELTARELQLVPTHSLP